MDLYMKTAAFTVYFMNGISHKGIIILVVFGIKTFGKTPTFSHR